MVEAIFILVLGSICAALLIWGFNALPQERWQMLAAVPLGRDAEGRWNGLNLTYYGFFTACGALMAVLIMILLLGAIGISLWAMIALVGILFACAMPSARLIARYVEGKPYGFTIGGASFVGVLILPWAIVLINRLGHGSGPMPIVPGLAAIVIGYAFGEGVGRLACISFGCCYGKALQDCPAWLQRIFAHRHFIFQGKNKKIAYASGMDCQKVVPIQAVTATIYVACGLLATALFLFGWFRAALALSLIVTQAWRAISELFRSDYRGEQKISAYQIMSVLAIFYMLGVFWLAPNPEITRVELMQGIRLVWHPSILLMLQGLWLVVFLYTGRSMVTGSTISFHVHRERV